VSRIFQLCLIVLVCEPSAAFVLNQNSSGKVLHWNLTNLTTTVPTNVVNRQTRSVRYFIASDAFSEANSTAEINAVRASFDQWQSVPGTALKFEFGGLAGRQNDVNTSDKTNVIFWKKGTISLLVNGQLDDLTGRHAITYNSFSSDYLQKEADIVLNGVEEGWFTDFNDSDNPQTFIEGILLHEIGHFIGLEHSPVGGASLFARSLSGLSTAAGLSADEIAAARFLYPQPDFMRTLGAVRGRVTKDGEFVLGAQVFAENQEGNIIAGTVTRAAGGYQFPALPPGLYSVRVSPLDPADAPAPLVTGRDIADLYEAAETEFLPTANFPVTISAGATNIVNLAVQQGSPAFRIAYLRPPTPDATRITAVNAPVTIRPGVSGFLLGAFSADFPPGTTLRITGDGVTVGATSFSFKVINGLNLLTAAITVAPTATPGLRTLVAENGNEVAYANGFLEILPDRPDDNFDGLDDLFQRQYFSRFTDLQASPQWDFDGDFYSNCDEYTSGTNPTDPASLLKIERIQQTPSGTFIAWQSGSGRRYQVLASKSPGGAWQPLNEPVIASASITEFFDPSPPEAARFYWVQALP